MTSVAGLEASVGSIPACALPNPLPPGASQMCHVSMMLTGVVATLVLSQYVRSRVDRDDPSSQCLWWKEGTVISVEQSSLGNPETPGDTEFFAITASFQSWGQQLGLCGSIGFEERPRVPARKIADDGTTLVLFRQVDCDDLMPPCSDPRTCGDERDCWEHANGALAITTTSYEKNSGRISDSDIELNTPRFLFTTVSAPPCIPPFFDTNCVASDVQNTATHEFGHVLGLSHSPSASSTMSASALPGETSKRSLDADSKKFVCEVYPAGQLARTCLLPAYDGELGKASGCSAIPELSLLSALLLRNRRRQNREKLGIKKTQSRS